VEVLEAWRKGGKWPLKPRPEPACYLRPIGRSGQAPGWHCCPRVAIDPLQAPRVFTPSRDERVAGLTERMPCAPTLMSIYTVPRSALTPLSRRMIRKSANCFSRWSPI
jgi:hypothetical protein